MGQPLRILNVGLDELCFGEASRLLPGQEIHTLPCDLERLANEMLNPPPAIILCGPPPPGAALNEVAQGIRLCYPDSVIHFVTSIREGYDRKALIKNGFTDSFLLPPERDYFKDVLQALLTELTKGEIKSYRAVRLVDVEPGTALPFDTFIYLAANNKYLKFSSKGDVLDESRVQRLQKHQVGEIHLTTDQVQDFYKFSAERLKKLGNNTAISETERRDRMKASVRDIISQMFSDSSSQSTTQGKGLVQDCHEIVKKFILEDLPKEYSWFEKVLGTIESAGSYSHAANVATLAALFSIGTGVGKPSELAMAGLLHDVGLADLPNDLQNKPREQFTFDDEVTYRTHVELSLKIIRNRKLVVPEVVMKAIELHHEKMDGSGYPRGSHASGKRFIPEAQILALASDFDRLTAITPGKFHLSAIQAVDKIRDDCFKNRAQPLFDIEIMKKWVDLFPVPPRS